MITFLKNFKKTFGYKLILAYIIMPLYELIWQYVINFKGKIYYFLWFSKKRIFIDLDSNDKKLIFKNFNFKKIASKIFDYCSTNLLERSKEEILNDKLSGGNPTNSGKKRYNQNLFSKLPKNLQKEIFELAQSELLISTAAKHLKVFPILDKVLISHNIPNKPGDVRGAMLWHKDDFGYRSLDLFMAISDINEFNGPLKVLKKK